MNYTRNSDPTYYESNCSHTNCGSYALRLKEWYDPEDYFEKKLGFINVWIEDQSAAGYSDEEISDMYSEILVEGMLKEFEGELRICDGAPPKSDKEELIAFSTWCYNDFEHDYTDYDFHFKVYRDGKWSEKCGNTKVRDCTKEDWGMYISPPIYMYHKIS